MGTSDFYRVDPTRIYEYKNGDVSTIASIVGQNVPVGNNNVLLAGISGKRIRVHGWDCQNMGAANADYAFKSGAVTVLNAWRRLAYIAGGPVIFDDRPVIDSGYFETATGEDLRLYVLGAAVNITVYYTVYTP